MLRDNLIADTEQEIFRHLPLSTCKSILFTSKASNKSMREHLFTRKEPEFLRHQEHWLQHMSLLGLLPAIMQDIPTCYQTHLPNDKPKLSILLLSARVLSSSTRVWLKTLNLMDLSARYDSYFFYSTSFVCLTTMLANQNEFTEDNIRKLRTQFSQASTEQLKKYLAIFVNHRVARLDQKILLTYLIPYLVSTDQYFALDILKNDFSGKINGAFLFNHIQDIDSKLTEGFLSPQIISYLSFIWQKILLLETTDAYMNAEDKQPGKINMLESILLYLPLSEQRKIFSHYLAQSNSASTTHRQQIRALRITSLLAPNMPTFKQQTLLDTLCIVVDSHDEKLTPIALQALSHLAGNFSGNIRDVALNKFLARMPQQPDTQTPAYYFSSFLALSAHINHLSLDQYKRMLDHAMSLFVIAKAETNAFKLIRSTSEHTSILIKIAINYPKAIDLAFESWIQLANLLAARLKHPEEDEAIRPMLTDLVMQLNFFYHLLPFQKQKHLINFLKESVNHSNQKIQLFGINGLEKLINHLDTEDQLFTIKKTWQIYWYETHYFTQMEALNLLIHLTTRIKSPAIHIQIARLLADNPHSEAKSVVQSVINTHAKFFRLTGTTTKAENHAHSPLNCNA